MTTYYELKAQLAELARQAEQAKALEVHAVIDEIRAKVAEYGLTEKDIFGRRRRAKAKKALVGMPKYRNPKTGAEWTGHGRAPAWIKAAKDRTLFLIASSASAAPVKQTSRHAAGKGATSERTTAGKSAQTKPARRVSRGSTEKETMRATG